MTSADCVCSFCLVINPVLLEALAHKKFSSKAVGGQQASFCTGTIARSPEVSRVNASVYEKKERTVSKNKRLIDSGILFQMHENNCIAIEHSEKGDSMSKPKPVALQLYSVRELLDQDFEGTVRRVAEMGYIGVEAYGGMPGGLKNSADLFAELELEVCSSHVAFPDDANKDGMLAVAEAYGVSRVAVAYLPPDNFETIDSIKGVCERLNRAGEFADSNNLSLGYHNHWWGIQASGRPSYAGSDVERA